MQAQKIKRWEWLIANIPGGKNQYVEALVLMSAKMSGGTTADELWQAWVTDEEVSWWGEGR